jgi:hypothetical protein
VTVESAIVGQLVGDDCRPELVETGARVPTGCIERIDDREDVDNARVRLV